MKFKCGLSLTLCKNENVKREVSKVHIYVIIS